MLHFLRHNSKVTMDHKGAFHKGFIELTPEGDYNFCVRRNLRSTKVDWSMPLPSFRQNWPTMLGENIIIPGHSTISSFL